MAVAAMRAKNRYHIVVREKASEVKTPRLAAGASGLFNLFS
jgi:hypothetical protein